MSSEILYHKKIAGRVNFNNRISTVFTVLVMDKIMKSSSIVNISYRVVGCLNAIHISISRRGPVVVFKTSMVGGFCQMDNED